MDGYAITGFIQLLGFSSTADFKPVRRVMDGLTLCLDLKICYHNVIQIAVAQN